MSAQRAVELSSFCLVHETVQHCGRHAADARGAIGRPRAEDPQHRYWGLRLGAWTEQQQQELREKGADTSIAKQFAVREIDGQLHAMFGCRLTPHQWRAVPRPRAPSRAAPG